MRVSPAVAVNRPVEKGPEKCSVTVWRRLTVRTTGGVLLSNGIIFRHSRLQGFRL